MCRPTQYELHEFRTRAALEHAVGDSVRPSGLCILDRRRGWAMAMTAIDRPCVDRNLLAEVEEFGGPA